MYAFALFELFVVLTTARVENLRWFWSATWFLCLRHYEVTSHQSASENVQGGKLLRREIFNTSLPIEFHYSLSDDIILASLVTLSCLAYQVSHQQLPQVPRLDQSRSGICLSRKHPRRISVYLHQKKCTLGGGQLLRGVAYVRGGEALSRHT